MKPIERLNAASEAELLLLGEHFHARQPLGPEDASKISDPDAAWLIFNPANELCRAYTRSPRIVVGRRGSGKTSMVKNTGELEDHDLTVEINTAEAIEYVRDAIFLDVRPEDTFVERIAEFWDFCIDALLARHAVQEFGARSLPKCSRFLKSFELTDNSYMADIVNAARSHISDAGAGPTGFFIKAFYEWLHSDKDSFKHAAVELADFLKANDKSCVVIIDSIEDYKLSNSKNEATLQGLLKCIGSYGDFHRSIRLCLPGETFFELRRLSSNLMKDFADCLLLQWLPSEILGVVAWRYLIYLRLHHPHRLEGFERIDLRKSDHRQKVLNDFLADSIINSVNEKEPTLAYILRHSQLLPRQIILILNSICSHIDLGGGEKANREHIVDGIKDCEETICYEIFGAFRHKYPFAADLCRKLVPELRRVFTEGELRIAYNEVGRKVVREYPVDDSFDEVRSALIEMGVIGRVRGVSSSYINGEFEYSRPGRLDVARSDQLCLHPLFSGVWESNVNRTGDTFIYPHYHWLNDTADSSRRIWTRL